MTGYALNLPSPGRDQDTEPSRGGGFFPGTQFMQSIRPDNSDPIPLRNPPQSMGHIMIRFVVLLALAVVVLALAWSR
jgi:hypothetical protein